jgi:glyceraldehyde 3-phosphate dehydrogenase
MIQFAGRFNGTVEVKKEIFVNGKTIRITAERNLLTWNEVDVDVVAGTGFFTTIETANEHIKGGAKVIISAPSMMSDVCYWA